MKVFGKNVVCMSYRSYTFKQMIVFYILTGNRTVPRLQLGKATGDTKNKKKLTNNPPKAPKPKAEPGHY